MIKNILMLAGTVVCLASCNGNKSSETTKKLTALQQQLDSLNREVQNQKPGLGEIMSDAQLHHEKLWFAANEKNWKLADFEVKELIEAFDKAKTIETDRPEVVHIPMITPPLNYISHAIKVKDLDMFKKGYNDLTNTCNACHTTTNFEFNVIKIPDTPPVSDQDFKPHA